ncbi:Kinesin-like protein kif3a [Boothiomyces sp. JEL0866]|nr:Kinesin-like protein kif3a [Boothiomyces sp. JEL0866]
MAENSAQNVQVAIRIRNVPSWRGRDPNSVKNTEAYGEICASVNERSPKTGVSTSISLHQQDKKNDYSFDYVFAGEDDQQMVYGKLVQPIIDKCLNGFNGCIFTYGQTAAGKTYTMGGPPVADPAQRGIIPRVAAHILNYIEEHCRKEAGGVGKDYTVGISYLEIYNEQLRDLLVDSSAAKKKGKIDPHSVNGKSLYVQGLTEQKVTTESDFTKIMTAAVQRRMVAETNMNAVSSRSHAVLTITVTSVERTSEDLDIPPIKKMSKIHLIDLAGSERANSTGATGDRLKEGAAINQSLSCLGNVINALSTGQTGHIPYRDSKLTYLLSDSLGGNSLTLLIACITPIAGAFDESLGTLRFAERAKKVKNKPTVNVDASTLRIMALEAENAELKLKLEKCTCQGGTIETSRKSETKAAEEAEVPSANYYAQSQKLKKFTNKLAAVMALGGVEQLKAALNNESKTEVGKTDLQKDNQGNEKTAATIIAEAIKQSSNLSKAVAESTKTAANDVILRWKRVVDDQRLHDSANREEMFKKDLEQLAIKNDQLSSEKNEALEKIKELQATLEDLKLQIDQSKNVQTNIQSQRDATSIELEELKMNFENFTKKQDVLEFQKMELAEKTAALERALDAHDSEDKVGKMELQNKYEELLKIKEQNSEQISALEKERNALFEKITQLNEQKQQIEAANNLTTVDNTDLKSKYNAVLQEMESIQAFAQELLLAKVELSNRVKELEQNLSQSNQQAAELEALKLSYEKLLNQDAENVKKLTELEHHRKNLGLGLDNNILNNTAPNQNIKDKLGDDYNNIIDIQNHRQQLMKENEVLNEKLQSLHQSLQSNPNESQLKDSINSKLIELQKNNQELASTNENYKNQILSLEADLKRAKEADIKGGSSDQDLNLKIQRYTNLLMEIVRDSKLFSKVVYEISKDAAKDMNSNIRSIIDEYQQTALKKIEEMSKKERSGQVVPVQSSDDLGNLSKQPEELRRGSKPEILNLKKSNLKDFEQENNQGAKGPNNSNQASMQGGINPEYMTSGNQVYTNGMQGNSIYTNPGYNNAYPIYTNGVQGNSNNINPGLAPPGPIMQNVSKSEIIQRSNHTNGKVVDDSIKVVEARPMKSYIKLIIIGFLVLGVGFAAGFLLGYFAIPYYPPPAPTCSPSPSPSHPPI